MTFRPNIRNKKKNYRFILGAALAALVLGAVIFPDLFFRITAGPAMIVMEPVLSMKNGLSKKWENLRTDFSDKNDLQNENAVLREKIMELEAKVGLLEVLGKENDILKNVFSAEEKKNFILGTVILKPVAVPFDTLVIDSGEASGIKAGMEVSAFGSVLLGYISDVSENISKIKLISSFGEETNVVLGSSGIPAIAVGRGGENFEIILPRSVSVSVGESVIKMGKKPMIAGYVERIEHRTADPLQKIVFRIPLNIQYLNYVFIAKK